MRSLDGGDHLGRRVARGPAGGLERLAVAVHVGQSEVDDFDVILIVK